MLFLPGKIDECPHVGIVKDGHEWLGLGCSWPLYIIVVTCLFDTLLVTGLLGIILCLNLEKKRKKTVVVAFCLEMISLGIQSSLPICIFAIQISYGVVVC